MLGSPVLYEQIEAELRQLLGVEDALLLPTLTHIHAAVIPVLAGGGTVLLDARAHKTVYDGAVMARARGRACSGSPTTTPRRWSASCASTRPAPG
jgi:8-amino-7-oxononanoate synthase